MLKEVDGRETARASKCLCSCSAGAVRAARARSRCERTIAMLTAHHGQAKSTAAVTCMMEEDDGGGSASIASNTGCSDVQCARAADFCGAAVYE